MSMFVNLFASKMCIIAFKNKLSLCGSTAYTCYTTVSINNSIIFFLRTVIHRLKSFTMSRGN